MQHRQTGRVFRKLEWGQQIEPGLARLAKAYAGRALIAKIDMADSPALARRFGVAQLPSLVFVLFMLPARLLTGWAVGRACRRQLPRHGVFRWGSRLGLVPIALLYAVFVYLTQYLSWNGSWSLLEQHAFLVPAPLMSL